MNFNERTNTLLYKNIYLSHFILERVDVSVICARWVETGTDCYIDTTIAYCVIFKNPHSTSSASWLGLLNQGSLRATALSLQAGPHSGLPVPNDSAATGICLYSFITPTCFHFSLAYLHRCISDWWLSQGSIYNTNTLGKSMLPTILFLLWVNSRAE